jgi:hypothetical protein
VTRIVQRTAVSPNSLHRLRYVKNKVLGLSIEQIAKEEKVKEENILRSISLVESYYAMNTMEELRASQVEVVLFNAELEKAALCSALQAETKIFHEKTGKLISREPNYDVRLKGVEMLVEIGKNLITADARSNAPSNNTQVNVNVAGGSTVGVATFEDRLREVRKKREALPTPPLENVIEAEIEELRPNWEGPLEQGSSQG